MRILDGPAHRPSAVRRLVGIGVLLAVTAVVPAAYPAWAALPARQTEEPTPAAKPAPSPAAKPAARGAAPPPPQSLSEWIWSGQFVTPTLTALGAVLIGIALYAWIRSNQAERRPNPRQLEQIRAFVEGHFAPYVARSLAATSGADPPLTVPNMAHDKAWKRVFEHHLDLHSELYGLSKRTALQVYVAHVDDAVRRELERADRGP